MNCSECKNGFGFSRPCPCCTEPTIQEWRIDLGADQTLTPKEIELIQRLDDHGFYSIDRSENGISIYLAYDGEENELHNELSEVFEHGFELVRVAK